MKLISMTDFVLDKERFKEDSDTAIFKVTNYAHFLKQPLELWMFVPCDENGNVLEEPKKESKYIKGSIGYYETIKYQQAKERVFFKGIDVDFRPLSGNIYFDKKDNLLFSLINGKFTNEITTIEDLVEYNIELTENAVKLIGN